MPDELDNLRTMQADDAPVGDASPAAGWEWATGTVEPADDSEMGRIDRYELLAKAGAGGFGMVFRARDTVAGIEVAIKLLPADLAHDPGELEKVRKNFALIKNLVHTHIAGIDYLHEVREADARSRELVGVSPGDYLVVMEYVPGASLAERPEGNMPVARALELCRQIADALDYAHSRKIIHRDIKPSNIQIDPDGQVKVLDFGLAAEIRHSLSRLSKKATDSSGTRPYMAPEQWRGEVQEAPADQYALAVLCHELISSRVPLHGVFGCDDDGVMRGAVLNEAPEPLAELSKKQNRALLRALAKDPSARFACCADFIAAMQGGKVPRRAAASAAAKKPGGRDILAVLGGLALVLIVLGVAGAVLFSFLRPATPAPPVALATPPTATPPDITPEPTAPRPAPAPTTTPPTAPAPAAPPPPAIVSLPATEPEAMPEVLPEAWAPTTAAVTPAPPPPKPPVLVARLPGNAFMSVPTAAYAPLEGLADGSQEAPEASEGMGR